MIVISITASNKASPSMTDHNHYNENALSISANGTITDGGMTSATTAGGLGN